MYTENWIKAQCPNLKCLVDNWVSQGDIQDCTIPDISTTMMCWKCDELFSIDEGEEVDEDNYEIGLVAPYGYKSKYD